MTEGFLAGFYWTGAIEDWEKVPSFGRIPGYDTVASALKEDNLCSETAPVDGWGVGGPNTVSTGVK